MSQVSFEIEKMYRSLGTDERLPIKAECIAEAQAIVRSYPVKNAEDLFLYLSAANLLNAALKLKGYKKKISYVFFKKRVKNVAVRLLWERVALPEADILYDKKENCLYFKVLDVVFSFHQIPWNEDFDGLYDRMTPIIWPGIKLQSVAQFVFDKAKAIVEERTGQTPWNADVAK